MCSMIVIQCTDSIGMISITSPTISHLHISNINDWKCLKRIDKCFLNAQLSSPHMPPTLIVSITNADNYVGWNCRPQKPFIAENYQIKVFAQNCFKEKLKRSVLSKPDGIFLNEQIGNSPNYAIYKIICFIVIPGIAGYCITIYLIFCIILAQRARIQHHQTTEEDTESYKQTLRNEREIKQWITNVTDPMKISSLSQTELSDLASTKQIKQLPKKQKISIKLVAVCQDEKFHSYDSRKFSKSSRVAQNLSSASLISLKIARENQRQTSLKYSSMRKEIKYDFKNRNRMKRLPRKTTKHMEINISKKSDLPNKSSWIRFRKENLRSRKEKSPVNLSIATSISRIDTKANLPIGKRSSNKLDQKKVEERQRRRGRFETFSRPIKCVTTPHEHIKNWQPYLQKTILTNRLDTQKMLRSRPLKIISSPRPITVQIIDDIPNDMKIIPTRRIRSQSCIIPIQQSNLIYEKKKY